MRHLFVLIKEKPAADVSQNDCELVSFAISAVFQLNQINCYPRKSPFNYFCVERNERAPASSPQLIRGVTLNLDRKSISSSLPK